MMRFYIADLHFNHGTLNDQMDNRGFESVEAMNEYMISRWNSRVRRGDEVVILGDFCMTRKGAEANAILERLNGKKYLIIGNHDKYLKEKDFDLNLLEWALPYKELNDNGRKIVLSHYPIICYNGQYRRSAKGAPKTYMLYGHVHNTFDEYVVNESIERIRQYKRLVRGSDELMDIPVQMINCFCMFSDYLPLTLDEWIKVDEERRKNMQLPV